MSDPSLNAVLPSMADIDSSAAEAVRARSLPGAMLMAAREAAGLSIEQAAGQLNLAPRQVLALEHDNFAALPGMVIVRGFLRAYAKLLKLDPLPLIASLGDLNPPAATPMRHALSASFSESRLPSLGGAGSRSRTTPIIYGVGLLVVVLIGGYALSWWPDGLVRRFGQLKLGGTPAAGTIAKPAVTAAEPGSNALHVAVADVAVPTTDMISLAPQPVAPVTGAAPVATVDVPVVALAAGAMNPLVLTMHEDSWIELRRADNTTLVAKVFKAGVVETFDLNEPVTLVVGNITGVTASLRGAPLGLAAGANGNVARLRLK